MKHKPPHPSFKLWSPILFIGESKNAFFFLIFLLYIKRFIIKIIDTWEKYLKLDSYANKLLSNRNSYLKLDGRLFVLKYLLINYKRLLIIWNRLIVKIIIIQW